MTEHIAPEAPDSLPKYIADGIPKQDVATLDELREYVDAMIEHKRRPVPEAEIPADADVVAEDNADENGTIFIRHSVCGDETCHCADPDDPGHGPYKYRVFRDEDGEVVHDYQGPA
jgi:hypothetical protein